MVENLLAAERTPSFLSRRRVDWQASDVGVVYRNRSGVLLMKRMMIAVLFSLFHVVSASSQPDEWLPGGTYEPGIPSPQSVLGYEIGTFLTDHHQMVDYIHRLAESTDRVQVVKYGTSIERRDMYLVIISSEENMARLEEIRSRIGKLADPRSVDAGDVAQIIEDTPPIGWLNFANDGGETAAFETGLLIAYQLAAGADPLSQRIRQNVVTVINPAANPDSHQTFVSWMKAATIGKRGTADPYASEHKVPWFISTDGNHYLIDSNRDAFALTQIETQAVAKVLHEWNPQLWIDNHGEPNEYYFLPYAAPVNLNYPGSLVKWATELGKNCARYFDRFGWTYVKDETFDLYYPGYWDSYPSFNGAIGGTYETNGGGWKNLSWEKPDGTIATLAGAIHAHFTADMASLEVLAEHRKEILRDFHGFFKSGIEEAASEQIKTYILPVGKDPGRLYDLIATLLRHGIEVFQTEGAISSGRTQSYFDRTSEPREFPAGTFVIPVAQPQKRILSTLLEPDPAMDERFLKQMRAARERNSKLGKDVPKESLGFYDVTAWALPLTFGVEAVLSEEAVSLKQCRRILKRPRLNVAPPEEAAYAYLFTNESDAGARLAGRLLQEDFRVAVTTRPFKNAGLEFPVGTFIARSNRNREALHDRVRELSVKWDVPVFSTGTAWSEEGVSLGSGTIVDLKKPRILVLSDEPTAAVAFGSVYALLEQRFGLEFTAARAEYFDEIDLQRYNVMIFPDGSASGYKRYLGEKGIEALKAWIQSGGTFIGIRGGAEFSTLEGVSFTDVKLVQEIEVKPEEGKSGEPEKKELEMLPGAIFRATVNTDYFLGFGYPEEIAVQVRGRSLLSTTENGANALVFPAQSHLMGHKWEDTESAMEGKLYLGDIPLGRGHVILFSDDPTFRAYWRGLDRLLINAVVLAPGFGPAERH